MEWENFRDIHANPGLQSDDRLWEYDNDGSKIYQLKCGFGLKTPWDGGRAYWEKNLNSDIKYANEIHYAVKGHLIPNTWKQQTIDNMVDQYTKRLWGNCERMVYCREKFEQLWNDRCNNLLTYL